MYLNFVIDLYVVPSVFIINCTVLFRRIITILFRYFYRAAWNADAV